jgi:hypothetical protein
VIESFQDLNPSIDLSCEEFAGSPSQPSLFDSLFGALYARLQHTISILERTEVEYGSILDLPASRLGRWSKSVDGTKLDGESAVILRQGSRL